LSIQGLVETLNNLSDIHESLLGLAREKQKLIIDNRVDPLMAITAKETKAIAAIEQLNRDVKRLTDACWVEAGLSPKPGSTVADLIQGLFRAESKLALTKAAERLHHQIEQLKEQNDRNQLLVRQSLDFIAFQIDLFTGPDDDGTYSPIKSSQTGAPRRMFDTRA
jgi:hypothetical protein